MYTRQSWNVDFYNILILNYLVFSSLYWIIKHLKSALGKFKAEFPSYWRIFNDPNGVYMDVHLINNGCLIYETPQTVGASLVSLNKNSFVESYDDREWVYSIVNDTVIEKVRLTGGNTNYFFKKDNSELEKLISENDYCN